MNVVVYSEFGAREGGGPHVEVFDGQDGQLPHSYFTYEPDFRGGVFVALSVTLAESVP